MANEGLKEALEAATKAVSLLTEVILANGGKMPASLDEVQAIPQFDMEEAIKTTGQWECGEIHCDGRGGGCTLATNLECLGVYGIADPPLSGKESEDEVLSMLHKSRRVSLPVLPKAKPGQGVAAVGKVRLPIVPPAAPKTNGTQAKPTPPPPAASKKVASKGKDEVTIPKKLDGLARGTLVGIATKLGMKEASKKKVPQLTAFIEKKRK